MDLQNHGLSHTTCPRCQGEVASERLNEEVIVCDNCSYTANVGQLKIDERTDRKSIKVMALMSALAVVSFVHSSQWGGAALEIIPLKTKQILGQASSQDLRSIAEICKKRVKISCVKTALASLHQAEPQNLEVKAELANFLKRARQFQEAEVAYSEYFAAGGTDSFTAYDYAQLLEKNGKLDEAVKIYDVALANKPDVLQVTIVQSYVGALMKNGRNAEAKTLIESIREKGESAKAFMTKEYDQITSVAKASDAQ